MQKTVSAPFALAVLFGLLLGSLEPAAAQAPSQPITLKVQASWGPAIRHFDAFNAIFVERVAKLSGGRVKIEQLAGGAVVGPLEVLDATSRGVIDGAVTYAPYWVGKHKAAVLFGGAPGGPFGMDPTDFVGWLIDGGGLELYRELYQEVLKLNVVPFPIMSQNPQVFGWFKRPIRGWEDLKGLKIRMSGIAADIYKEAGMAVVTLAAGEILPAAERGVIDAAEIQGGDPDLKLGFHQVWKYHYAPGMAEANNVQELVINKGVWDRLGPQLQEVIRSAVMESLLRSAFFFRRIDAEAYQELVHKHGVEVRQTPSDILLKTLEVWDKMVAEESARDPFFKKVIESQRRYAGLIVPYRLSIWPPYDLAGNYYWKDAVYRK
ncbi:MAG: exported solute-binding protein [Candidatus Tectimicrobiota bacterium]|nr:MAG: exported solute-binding protein [Candidatus Tectomicrobia bacterium]